MQRGAEPRSELAAASLGSSTEVTPGTAEIFFHRGSIDGSERGLPMAAQGMQTGREIHQCSWGWYNYFLVPGDP